MQQTASLLVRHNEWGSGVQQTASLLVRHNECCSGRMSVAAAVVFFDDAEAFAIRVDMQTVFSPHE